MIDVQPWAKRVGMQPGGLMRCCEATINRLVRELPEEPAIGTTFHCDYEPPESADSIAYTDGCFVWAGSL